MGYFLFGGSDIVMLFQSGVTAELVCPESATKDGYEHVLMGEPYMNLDTNQIFKSR